MTRLHKIGILICIAVFLFASTAICKPPRVAVMDFENKSQHGGWRIGRGASDILTTELVKVRKFRMMERDRLSSLLKEQDLGVSGRIDPSTAAKIGKVLGVEYIITGAVTEYGQSGGSGGGFRFSMSKKGYHATVDVRMVNAATGEIVFADSGSHSKSSTTVKVMGYGGGESYNEKAATEVLRGAIKKVAMKITSSNVGGSGVGGGAVKAMPPEGKAVVADVDGKIISLNKGENVGFKSGQKITIYRKGKVIKDPSTGKVLKIKYKKIGVIKLTNVESSYSEGKVVSGKKFEVGDIVK